MRIVNFWPELGDITQTQAHLRALACIAAISPELDSQPYEFQVVVGHGENITSHIGFTAVSNQFSLPHKVNARLVLLILCNPDGLIDKLADSLIESGVETVVFAQGNPDPDLMFGRTGLILRFFELVYRQNQCAERALQILRDSATANQRGAELFTIAGNRKVYSSANPRSLPAKKWKKILFNDQNILSTELVDLAWYWLAQLVDKADRTGRPPEMLLKKYLALNDYYLPMQEATFSTNRIVAVFEAVLSSNQDGNCSQLLAKRVKILVAGVCFEIADHNSHYVKCEEYVYYVNTLKISKDDHFSALFYSAASSLLRKRGAVLRATKVIALGIAAELDRQNPKLDVLYNLAQDLADNLACSGQTGLCARAIGLISLLSELPFNKEQDDDFQFAALRFRHALLTASFHDIKQEWQNYYALLHHGQTHIDRGLEKSLIDSFNTLFISAIDEPHVTIELMQHLNASVLLLAEKHSKTGTLEEEFALLCLVVELVIHHNLEVTADLAKACKLVYSRKKKQQFHSALALWVNQLLSQLDINIDDQISPALISPETNMLLMAHGELSNSFSAYVAAVLEPIDIGQLLQQIFMTFLPAELETVWNTTSCITVSSAKSAGTANRRYKPSLAGVMLG